MNLRGFEYFPNYLDRSMQEDLLNSIRKVVLKAPLFIPVMPGTGKEMSVQMTNCGKLGWVTDKEIGYRYQSTHPKTNAPWPEIPSMLIKLWQELSQCSVDPEACLVNFYDQDARMGLHQDKDEFEPNAPVISISLGDSCLFRFGRETKGGKTHSVRLNSGDIIMFGGQSRFAYHGVDRLYAATSTLLKTSGRASI